MYSWFKGKTKVKEKDQAKELFSTLLNHAMEAIDLAIYFQEGLYENYSKDEKYYQFVDVSKALETDEKNNKILIKINDISVWVVKDDKVSYNQKLSILYSWKANVVENIIFASNILSIDDKKKHRNNQLDLLKKSLGKLNYKK
jgi:hypothetical protein